MMTFEQANEYIERKALVPTGMSSAEIALSPALPPAVRGHAFFSARVTQVNVLEKLRDEVSQFVAGDVDIATARLRIKTFLSRQGFAPDDVSSLGTKDAGRSITNLASTHRINLILRQNAAMAFAAGQRNVAMNPDVKERWPYYKYDALGDARETHGALDGMVLSKDDPFWNTHTPPWEFNCRCAIYDADKDEAAEAGGEARAVTTENPDGSQTSTVAYKGKTVNVPPSASGFVFRADAPWEPNFDAIADGPLKEILIEQYNAYKAQQNENEI